MKVLAYIDGQPSSDDEARAARVRADGSAYLFRSATRFGVVEPCDAIVAEEDRIVAAYAALGVGVLGEDAPEAPEEVEPLAQLTVVPTVAPEPPSPPDGFAVPTLEHDDAALRAYLVKLDAEKRSEFFAAQDDDALAGFLVTRAGKERKAGWTTGTMGNMIERHIGLEA